jgi:hypothetical protein
MSSRTGSGRGERNVSSPDRSSTVYLRGSIPHGDHDRRCDPNQLTNKRSRLRLGDWRNYKRNVCLGARAMSVVGANSTGLCQLPLAADMPPMLCARGATSGH